NTSPEVKGNRRAGMTPLILAKSNRRVPVPVIEETETVYVAPEPLTLLIIPLALPEVAKIKSPASRPAIGSAKVMVKLTAGALVGETDARVMETTEVLAGGTTCTAAILLVAADAPKFSTKARKKKAARATHL